MLEEYILTTDQINSIVKNGENYIKEYFVLSEYLKTLKEYIKNGTDSKMLEFDKRSYNYLQKFVKIAENEDVDISKLVINVKFKTPKLVRSDEVRILDAKKYLISNDIIEELLNAFYDKYMLLEDALDEVTSDLINEYDEYRLEDTVKNYNNINDIYKMVENSDNISIDNVVLNIASGFNNANPVSLEDVLIDLTE